MVEDYAGGKPCRQQHSRGICHRVYGQRKNSVKTSPPSPFYPPSYGLHTCDALPSWGKVPGNRQQQHHQQQCSKCATWGGRGSSSSSSSSNDCVMCSTSSSRCRNAGRQAKAHLEHSPGRGLPRQEVAAPTTAWCPAYKGLEPM